MRSAKIFSLLLALAGLAIAGGATAQIGDPRTATPGPRVAPNPS